jgi:trans-aconitate methyltransferase
VNKPSEPTQDEVIQSWHDRAHAYDNLIQRWPIFTELVRRLLEFLPNKFDGHALDIGGGSGLLTEQLLEKCPNAHITLVEPANEMRALASRRFGKRIEVKNLTSDYLNKIEHTADAAFSSASFHLMNEETT